MEFFICGISSLTTCYEEAIFDLLFSCRSLMRDLLNLKVRTARIEEQCTKNLLRNDIFGNIKIANLAEHVEMIIDDQTQPTFAIYI